MFVISSLARSNCYWLRKIGVLPAVGSRPIVYIFMKITHFKTFQTLLNARNDSFKEKLRNENTSLKLEIENLKKCFSDDHSFMPTDVVKKTEQEITLSSSQEVSSKLGKPKNKEKDCKAPPKASTLPPSDCELVDVSRLDFRIGHILEVEKHPDADSLYVEKVNVGEDKPRTVVSGLVKHMPPSALQGKMVVLLCNLKPAKMRGITSEAMVMCASTPEKVEVLMPPKGSSPGDVVEFEGYKRVPDAILNPKKKIFESCAPDLKTNSDLIATYKGVPFVVPGKGVVKTQSLSNVSIK